MSTVMKFLADYWMFGMPVMCVIVLVIYLLVSVKIVKFCRSEGMNTGPAGMFPIIQLVSLLKGKHRKSKRLKEEYNSTPLADDEVIEL